MDKYSPRMGYVLSTEGKINYSQQTSFAAVSFLANSCMVGRKRVKNLVAKH